MVHTVSSADPTADLPSGAARALQEALLMAPGPGVQVDLGTVLERCDAARELLERWQDAFFAALPDEIDVEEEARWAAEAGMSFADVEAQYDDEDDAGDELLLDPAELGAADELDGLVDLTGPADDDPRRLLPEELVTVLERELLLLPLRVRLEALVAAVEVVSTWADLVADHEKLLGHLVLSHGEPQAVSAHEALVDRHAVLHATSGPGHAAADEVFSP